MKLLNMEYFNGMLVMMNEKEHQNQDIKNLMLNKLYKMYYMHFRKNDYFFLQLIFFILKTIDNLHYNLRKFLLKID